MKRRKYLSNIAAIGVGISLISITHAQTASGNPEVTCKTSIPQNTSITLDIFEDTNLDETAENTQSINLNDGTATYELSNIQGNIEDMNGYWVDIQMENNGSENVVLHNIDLVIPPTDTSSSNPTSTPSQTESNGTNQTESNGTNQTESNGTNQTLILAMLLYVSSLFASIKLRSAFGMFGVAIMTIALILTIFTTFPILWFWIICIAESIFLVLAAIEYKKAL